MVRQGGMNIRIEVFRKSLAVVYGRRVPMCVSLRLEVDCYVASDLMIHLASLCASEEAGFRI